ncbi:MAG: thymidylate synthase [Paludibacteraceae bacterium]|nr:thymidylate synthase [Paludibacteraceae bacterium]
MDTNYLGIKSRAELRNWYEINASTAKEMYIPISKSWEPQDGVVLYVDAVEEALCFGWIDSVHKNINGVLCSRFSPRRKGGNWTELNIARCNRLERLGLMTPAGRAVMPEYKPFIIPADIETAMHADTEAWAFLKSAPELYLRVRVSNLVSLINHGFQNKAQKQLQNVIKYAKLGRYYGQWNDNGRLLNSPRF